MARRATYSLDAQITADGNYVFSGPSGGWQGGNGQLMIDNASGTFGTAKLQQQAPNGTWMDTGAQLTAVGIVGFIAAAGPLRLNLASSVSPVMDAWLVGIPSNQGG